MSPVDLLKGSVITGFNAVLDNNIMGFGQICEVFQLFVIDAVGSGADDKTPDLRKLKGLPINSFQFFQCGIGV